jgi:tRNA A37 threonylcarbamoyladenosine modification protein TsaB
MYDFKELVTKKKSELVDLARKEDLKSPQALKKNKLIERLGDLTDLERKILYLGDEDTTHSQALREKCNEHDLTYDTVAKSSIRLLEHLEDQEHQEPKEEKDDVETEYIKAMRQALMSVRKHKMSYNIFQEKDRPRWFHIKPMYMKPEDEEEYRLKSTIVYYDS